MSDNKLPEHQYSDEELIQLASQIKEETNANQSDPEQKHNFVHKFINELGIKPGDGRIPASIVYLAYRDWCPYKPKSQIWFTRIFGRLFKKSRDDAYTYYHLDPGPFDLSEANFRRLRDFKARRRKPVDG